MDNLTFTLVTRDKSIDLQKRQTTRSVFTCNIIGAKKAGKSTFMKGFLGRSLNDQQNETIDFDKNLESSRYAINTVKIYGQEKYMIVSKCINTGA